MIRTGIAIALIGSLVLLGGSATAQSRPSHVYPLTSFERVRVEGPFEVKLTAGASPAGKAEGDPRALDSVVLRLDGTTLTVRRAPTENGAVDRSQGRPLLITLATPVLRGANVTGGGRLTITGAKGQRIDFAVTGSGTLQASALNADELNATIIGAGTMTLAGHAQRARLDANGVGNVEASGLDVGDLTVRLDGPGDIRAAAKFSASVTNTGLGSVEITGNAPCTISAPGGGAVTCGGGNKR
ncbi:head GIN domain-containing protein [Sphingomonas sp. GlSt437]|uniref:head GIN domain-containing protein n=1 Tax=Sphingomonas sp. GlSt437 TaxID=3389970 RepID=UPI003A89CE5F